MAYTIFHAGELEWKPRREGDPRLAAELSQAMTRSRANLFRYPPGAVGRRPIDPIQEEVFVSSTGRSPSTSGRATSPSGTSWSAAAS